jgi:beta-lactamase class D
MFKKIRPISLILLLVLLITSGVKGDDLLITSDSLANYFSGFNGAFILYDLKNEKPVLKFNESNFKKEDAPFSTFKIPHALIALQVGVLKDENSMIKWNETQYPISEWNRDQTLQTAMNYSVVWYFQETAERIGRETMQKYLSKIGYGNETIGNNPASFWLDDSLRISVEGQLAFINRLYREDLPFDKDVIKTVKKVIINDSGENYTLSGKTGASDSRRRPCVGWYVGYVVKGNAAYSFVTKIEGAAGANGRRAKEITVNILKSL